MISLFDRGHQLATDHFSWKKTPPGMELTAEARN
jgi:hypothetical protein